MHRIVFEQLLKCPLELAGEAKAQYSSCMYWKKFTLSYEIMKLRRNLHNGLRHAFLNLHNGLQMHSSDITCLTGPVTRQP